MAEDSFSKSVIISISADPSTAKKAMAELETEIQKLAASNKQLKKEQAEAIAAGDTAKVEALTASIVENNARTKELRSTAALAQKQFLASAGSIEELRAQTSLMSKRADQFRVGVHGTAEELDQLKNSVKNNVERIREFDMSMGKTQSNVGNYKQAIMEAIKGNSGMAAGINNMGVAFKTNPIGFFVGLVIQLIQYLQKVQPVMDVVSEVMGSVGAVMDVVISRLGHLVKAVIAFTSGNFAEAAAEMGSAVGGLGNAMLDAAKQGNELVKMQKELDDAFERNSLTMAENETRIAGMMKQLNDRTKSEQDRLKIAEEIQKLEKENLKIEEDKAKGDIQVARQKLLMAFTEKERAEAAKLSNKELIKLAQDGAKQDELWQSLAEKSIALEDKKRASIALTEKVEARVNAIVQEGETKRAAAAAKEKARREKAAEDQKKAIEKQKADREKAIAENEKLIRLEYDTQQKANKILFDQQQLQLKQQFADKLITEQQYNEQSKQLQLDRMNAELLVMQDYKESVKLTDEEIAAKKIEIANYTAEQQIAANKKITDEDKIARDKLIAQAQQQAQQTEAVIVATSGVVAQAMNDQQDAMKSFSKGMILIALDMAEKFMLTQVAQAAAGSMAQIDSIATFGATGLARAAILTGLIKGGFGIIKSQINAYAKGTDNAPGGLALVGEEGPELVQLPRGARVFPTHQTQKMLPFVGAFAKGGTVGDGGFAARSISNQVTSSIMPDFSRMKFGISIHEFIQKQSSVDISDNVSKF